MVSELKKYIIYYYRSYDDVHVSDSSLADHIAVESKHSQVFLPHTAGRWYIKYKIICFHFYRQSRRFRKNQCPIVERLVNSLMMHGRNSGKKLY